MYQQPPPTHLPDCMAVVKLWHNYFSLYFDLSFQYRSWNPRLWQGTTAPVSLHACNENRQKQLWPIHPNFLTAKWYWLHDFLPQNVLSGLFSIAYKQSCLWKAHSARGADADEGTYLALLLPSTFSTSASRRLEQFFSSPRPRSVVKNVYNVQVVWRCGCCLCPDSAIVKISPPAPLSPRSLHCEARVRKISGPHHRHHRPPAAWCSMQACW